MTETTPTLQVPYRRSCGDRVRNFPRGGAIGLLALFVGLLLAGQTAAAPRRPNVVLIMTDNHGPWTLGCYGNHDVQTPNIDRLANQGSLFTRCFSSNPVCSPTRATWLTGLIPSQHGVHCYIAPKVQIGPKAFGTIDEFRSIGDILAKAGYQCGLSGKWHLGRNMEPQEGFSFWVTKPGGSTGSFYDQPVIEDGKISKVPGYITDYWTRRGVEFIEQNKDRPFFLFLAYNGPYGLSDLLLRASRNRHASFYADKPLLSFPRRPMHPWLYNNRDYLNNPVSMRRYASEISGIDDGVGQIMATLQRLSLDDQTLVVFTADQGLAGGQGGIWGMGDHTRPLSAFDSTMHVPLIFRWPGHVPSRSECRLLVSNYDFYPTLLNLLDLQDQIPDRPPRPGRNYAPVLCKKELNVPWDNAVFYEFETVRAVRTDRWKLVERLRDGPTELYDLTKDPEEQQNWAGKPEVVEVQRGLSRRLRRFFTRYADPKYDLAHGGRSKAQFLHSDSRPVVRHSKRDGTFTLDVATVTTRGPNLHIDHAWQGIVGWKQNDDRAVWSLTGVREGAYRIYAQWRTADGQTASNLPFLEIDGKQVLRWPSRSRSVTRDARSGTAYDEVRAGPLVLSAGKHQVTVGLAGEQTTSGFLLHSIRLQPDP